MPSEPYVQIDDVGRLGLSCEGRCQVIQRNHDQARVSVQISLGNILNGLSRGQLALQGCLGGRICRGEPDHPSVGLVDRLTEIGTDVKGGGGGKSIQIFDC